MFIILSIIFICYFCSAILHNLNIFIMSKSSNFTFSIKRRDYLIGSSVLLRSGVAQSDLKRVFSEVLSSYPDSPRFELYSCIVFD